MYAALEVFHNPQQQVQQEKRRSRFNVIRNWAYHSACIEPLDIRSIERRVQQELERSGKDAAIFVEGMYRFLAQWAEVGDLV